MSILHTRANEFQLNCKNCGAPLKSKNCDYCGTTYESDSCIEGWKGTVLIDGEKINVYVGSVEGFGMFAESYRDSTGTLHMERDSNKRKITLIEV
jgi:RNA polymerase subunit RPABC4/transcription elongation factor Spt4